MTLLHVPSSARALSWQQNNRNQGIQEELNKHRLSQYISYLSKAFNGGIDDWSRIGDIQVRFKMPIQREHVQFAVLFLRLIIFAVFAYYIIFTIYYCLLIICCLNFLIMYTLIACLKALAGGRPLSSVYIIVRPPSARWGWGSIIISSAYYYYYYYYYYYFSVSLQLKLSTYIWPWATWAAVLIIKLLLLLLF